MPGLALTVTPAVLTLLFGGQPTHAALAPTSALYVEMGHIAPVPRSAGSFEPALRFSAQPPAGSVPTVAAAGRRSSSSSATLSRRFIVIGSAAAGLAGGGLMFLLPGSSPRPSRDNPRITLRLGRYRTATAMFGASF